jgi:1-acyl-sn-glycerol-3-phosphate acyltransferase
MRSEVLVNYADAAVETTHWRTFLVLAHTLSGSAKVFGRSLVRRGSLASTEAVVRRWCDHIFRISRLTLEVRGRENIPLRDDGTAGGHVLISHHESLLDVPCVIRAWPGVVRMVAKEELSKVPVFGPAMGSAGIVFVDRGDREKAIEQLKAARPLLEQGTSLWVAAEGTRARGGKIGKFKKGGFHTALELQASIVPVWIQGTSKVIVPDQWASTTGQRVVVCFGEPIPTAGKTREDLESLVAETRAQMLELAKGVGAPDDIDALA